VALVLDSGPIVAAFDRSDRHHVACRRLLETSTEELVIPVPVLTEVDYILGSRVDKRAPLQLLADIADGVYRLEPLDATALERILELMTLYLDAPLGLVDASVLAIVERLNETKVGTLDHRHFRMMRPRHVESLRLLPE
jgi:predicted nucleic acid-binding protein